MIRLFLADIDGCLSEPYTPFRLDVFARLRAVIEQAEADPRVPQIGICSGRSYAYVEATAQALGLRAPALFESGGGRFDLTAARIAWNPALTPEAEAALDEVRAFLRREIVPRSATVSFDFGKRAQAGVVSPVVGECPAFLDEIAAYVGACTPGLRAFSTPYSVDVLPHALTKADALAWLARTDGLDLAEIAFIGDTEGDAAAIRACGFGLAPANGDAAARAAADLVTDGAVLDGVLEGLAACLHRNGLGEAETADLLG